MSSSQKENWRSFFVAIKVQQLHVLAALPRWRGTARRRADWRRSNATRRGGATRCVLPGAQRKAGLNAARRKGRWQWLAAPLHLLDCPDPDPDRLTYVAPIIICRPDRWRAASKWAPSHPTPTLHWLLSSARIWVNCLESKNEKKQKYDDRNLGSHFF